MSKHTPGPWTAGIHGLTVDAVHPVRNDATGTTPVAFISGYFGEAQEANARLIAAAPELLAALEAVMTHAEAENADFSRAYAAIAKAKEG
jgi:hypothetical protein